MEVLLKTIEFGRPMISQEEKDAVLRVLNSPQLVHGPVSLEFEDAFSTFIGGGYSTSTSSATTALQLAYMVLGIGRGDEVIVTSLTHVATANSIVAVGATPVFVDVDLETGNISTKQIEKAITEKTKAICVVHYLGVPVKMDEVLRLSKSKGLFVIEDCALALGTYFGSKHVGILGDFGAFSFYPAKHITTGEGGMLVSKEESMIVKAAKTKAFYYSKNVGDRKIPGLYDIVGFGLNLRMSEIAAAIGIEQLKKLPEFLKVRERNIELLTSEFTSHSGRFLKHKCNYGSSGNYCSSFVLEPRFAKYRDKIILRLKEFGIGCSIYYPVSLPESTFYKSNPDVARTLPTLNAQYLATSSIAFGIGPHLSESDMLFTRNSLSRALEEVAS